MSAAVHVAVLGATGATGRLLVTEALARGHTVTALARRPAAVGWPSSAALRVVAADVTEPESVAAAVAGVDVVVSALGHAAGSPAQLLTAGAHAVTAVSSPAAGARPGPRLVWLGAWGTGPSAAKAGPLVRALLRIALRAELADKIAADRLVLDAGGTVVHAGPLTNGAPAARPGVRTLAEMPSTILVRGVSRATVAATMLDEAEHPRHRGEIVVPH